MRIGIDASSWGNNRGYGRYTRSIFNELVTLDRNRKYTFFVDSSDLLEKVPTGSEVVLVDASSPTTSAAGSDSYRSISDMWRMSRSLSTPNIDILLFPTIYSYVPVFTRAKKIVVIHDVIPEKYPELTLPSRRARLFWKLKSGLGRMQADAIIAVSEFSRQCLIEQFNIAPESIYVVGEASDPIFRVIEHPTISSHLTSLGISETTRIIIYVGGFGPHKNIDTLVSALAEIVNSDDFFDVKLVMVGENQKEVFYSEINSLKNQIQALGLKDRVIFTGFLPDEELVDLLNISTVLVLPSLMEGFGLPAVEAAACGCPVIATTESPLPELLREGGLYVDPLNPDELGLALERVLSSKTLQKRMRGAGLQAVQSLTWGSAANQMMNVINQTAAL
jgi:glycosyltransferase involved in cell wall biosynthesis